jgi:DNA polymerase III alpha subunit (gram-positive type)
LFEEVANDIVEWLKGTVVVCHNAQFDMQFLDSEFRRLGREIQVPNLVDTLLLARQYFDLPSYSLLSIAEAFHIPMTVAHRALDDAHTGRGIFFAMMESLKELGRPLDDYIGIYNSPRLTTMESSFPQNWAKRSTAANACSFVMSIERVSDRALDHPLAGDGLVRLRLPLGALSFAK